MSAEQLTIPEFQAAIRAGRFVPGDAVLYRYGRRSPLAMAIAHVQRRALRDLLGLRPAGTLGAGGVGDLTDLTDLTDRQAKIAAAAQYTHAGMVVDAELSAEMTSPRARLISWQRRMRVGDRVLIVRPLPLPTDAQTLADVLAATQGRLGAANIPDRLRCRLYSAADDMCWLASKRTRYPWRELLTYWFASLPGAIAAPHFAEYFRDHRRNVCSGAIWEAWVSAGCIGSYPSRTQYPEAWYPARMAVYGQYLERVAALEIVAAAEERMDLPDLPDPTDRKQETTMSWQRRTADAVPLAIVVLTAAYVMLSLCGCRGGLIGGKQSPDQGKGDIKVYEVHFATGANSIANIGNAGTQSPMYQAGEAAVEATPAGAGAYQTTPSMPASGAANAGTMAAKYGMQVINDGVKRSAESDISAAAQLLAGNTQTQAGMNPATTQRAGTTSSAGTTTGTNEANPTGQMSLPLNMSGSGTAQQTPTATQAGAGSTPGAVTGGTGTATGSDTSRPQDPAEASTTNPPAAGPKPTYETVRSVTANEGGTTTVVTADGKTYTGKIISYTTGTDPTIAILQPTDGTLVRYLQGSGVVGQALCPGCSAPGVTITADSAGQ